MAKNALQAVLDRAAQSVPAAPIAPVERPKVVKAQAKPRVSDQPAAETDSGKAFYRPSREGKHLISGHFPKSVSKQLKLLSVEEDTTVQELLGEALDLLFVKKGRARIAELLGGSK